MGILGLGVLPVVFVLLIIALVSVEQQVVRRRKSLTSPDHHPVPELDDPTLSDDLRASDDARTDAIAILHTATIAGRLTPTEGEERMQTVTNGRTLGDLRTQLTDLPHTRRTC